MGLYPKSVTKKCHQKILKQMNNSICKIKNKKEIGIFSYIKYKHSNIYVIIINKYINNEEYLNTINIILNDQEEIIEINEIIFKDKINNISIIKIKNNNKNIKYIEIDDKLYEKESENYYKNESIYIFQTIINDILISYGIIKETNKNEIIYTGNINAEYSFIFNLNNNKLIGNHKNSTKYYNKGIIFNNIIKEIKNYSIMNEINILINIEKEDINKEIYFLNDTVNDIKELNDKNTELYINDMKEKYKTYIKTEKIGINKVTLKFNYNLGNIKNMFEKCEKIIDINFVYFNFRNVINMHGLFYGCKNLKNIKFFNIDTKNVQNMSWMFSGCISLNNIPDISKWSTKNVFNLSYMFYGCSSLNNLPDISKWETKNVENMRSMFSGCSSINSLPDISKWDTKKVKDMTSMFYDCSSLDNLPDISIWYTKRVKYMDHMFSGCSLLNKIPRKFIK